MNPFDSAFNVTSWFETGGEMFQTVSGNWDKQGMSFGPLQHNVGTCTLQCLLREIPTDILKEIFSSDYDEVFDILITPIKTAYQLNHVATKWNDERNRLLLKWTNYFKALGKYPEVQQAIMNSAKKYADAAQELAEWLKEGDKPTVREYCLAYDICVQNGGIGTSVRALYTLIRQPLKPFKKQGKDWLRFVAWNRACYSYIRGNTAFAIDVLERKLAIIEGTMYMRGRKESVDLDTRFGVSDEVY